MFFSFNYFVPLGQTILFVMAKEFEIVVTTFLNVRKVAKETCTEK
jgi:hypothetical protein